tara:strand:- start:824 stop:1201 length:378 start_codon:yes stop_codon:yes gene_type:complete
MKKILFIILISISSVGFAGPVVEIYECQINKGKTLEDLSNMMDTFSNYLKKAGLSDSYKAHAGFQQIPIKPGSVNWIGISPTAEDYGKAIEWFTSSEDGQTFGELYQSVYTCQESFMTFITTSSE